MFWFAFGNSNRYSLKKHDGKIYIKPSDTQQTNLQIRIAWTFCIDLYCNKDTDTNIRKTWKIENTSKLTTTIQKRNQNVHIQTEQECRE